MKRVVLQTQCGFCQKKKFSGCGILVLKAIVSFWEAQTISSSFVVSASIAVISLSVLVFSISEPPMVLISEESINSWLG